MRVGAIYSKKSMTQNPSYCMKRATKDLKALLSKIVKQTSGDIDEDEFLIEEYGIKSGNSLYCLEYNTRAYIKICRGQKCFMLGSTIDHLNRVLIYTSCGRIIEIDIDELIKTEFD